MATTDLGLVRDKITGVRLTSGSTAAGSDATYSLVTELNPSGVGSFTVHNGNDGGGILKASSKMTGRDAVVAFVNEIGGPGKVAAILAVEASGQTATAITECTPIYAVSQESSGVNDLNAVVINSLRLFRENGNEVSDYSYTNFVVVYFQEAENEITIDSDLDENSANPVQNSAITVAISQKLDGKITRPSAQGAGASSLEALLENAYQDFSSSQISNYIYTGYVGTPSATDSYAVTMISSILPHTGTKKFAFSGSGGFGTAQRDENTGTWTITQGSAGGAFSPTPIAQIDLTSQISSAVTGFNVTSAHLDIYESGNSYACYLVVSASWSGTISEQNLSVTASVPSGTNIYATPSAGPYNRYMSIPVYEEEGGGFELKGAKIRFNSSSNEVYEFMLSIHVPAVSSSGGGGSAFHHMFTLPKFWPLQ